MPRLLHPLVFIASLGCTRYTWLDAATAPASDSTSDADSASASPDIDTGDASSPGTGEDTSTDTAFDTPIDTATDTGVEPESPPQVCLPANADGFRMPSSRWALSALMASRRLSEPEGSLLQVSPSWLLAVAWQTDTFACGGYGTPWSDEGSNAEGGCYQIQYSTHWTELIRLFPEHFEAENWPVWIDGDTPERSTMALVHALYAGHLLLRRGIDPESDADPDTWLSETADPLAPTRLAAFFHFEGPWSATATRALETCNDNLLDCADTGLLHHTEGIEAKQAVLDLADCYNEPITDSDLDAFVEGIAPLWPHVDWTDARAQALDARTDTGFAVDGLAMVEAIEAAINAPLSCPAETLWDHYRYSCY